MKKKIWLHICKYSLCVAKEAATMVHITDLYVNKGKGHGSISERQILPLKYKTKSSWWLRKEETGLLYQAALWLPKHSKSQYDFTRCKFLIQKVDREAMRTYWHQVSCTNVGLMLNKDEEVRERGTNKGWNCRCLHILKCRAGYQLMLCKRGPTCSHWKCNSIL